MNVERLRQTSQIKFLIESSFFGGRQDDVFDRESLKSGFLETDV